MSSPRPRYGNALQWLALTAIVVLGVYVRVDDLAAWRAQAALSFQDGLPLLVNLDGYYFLSLARDLLEGSYDPVDALRAFPAGDPRPFPPPLLSVLVAGIAHVTGAPLDWIAVMLPALLGPLLALPVFAVGRRLAGPAAGLSAALVAVLSHYYVFRTNVGFFDTDCLNVTLAMTLVWWSLRLGDATPRRFAPWLGAGVVLLALYLWWWWGAHSAVIAFAGGCLACGLAASGRRRGERVAGVATAAVVAGAAVAWRGPELPRRLFEHVLSTFSHVAKTDQGAFPNLALSIGEQVPVTLSEAAEKTTGDPVLLAAAAAGLAWLMLTRRREALVLALPLALALMSGVFAQRFLIFAAPLTGLGTGYLVHRGLAAVGRRAWLRAAVLVGLVAAVAPAWLRGVRIVFMPAASAELVAGLRQAARETPGNAVVWALWDYGYNVRYWARRAGVNDGSVHTGELTTYNALPYAASSFRLAANFMQFYAVHGLAGVRRVHDAAGGPGPGLDLLRSVFTAGPEAGRELLERAAYPAPGGEGTAAWLAFLFPRDAPPLYLLMDQRMLHSAYWWYWFGSWQPGVQQGHHARMQPFAGVSADGSDLVSERIRVDTGQGRVVIDGAPPIALSRLVTSTTRGIRQQQYPAQGPEFHYFAVQGFGVLQDAQIARSVFSKAFVLKAVAPAHFREAGVWSGAFQLWEVRGERAD